MSATPRNYSEAWHLLSQFADAHELVQILNGISKRIAREFSYVLSSEDLMQEWCLHLASNPGHAKHWIATDKETGEQRMGWISFKRDAAGIMAKSARTEKAKTVGYEPDDEYFYSKKQLSALLPYVFRDPVLTVSEKDPDQRVSAPDHSKGGNHLAGVMDVRAAWDKVVHVGSQWDKVMQGLYRVGATQAQVGESIGVSQVTVSKTHQRCMDALLLCLNGTKPFSEPDGPGSRRCMSNAEAISRTERQ